MRIRRILRDAVLDDGTDRADVRGRRVQSRSRSPRGAAMSRMPYPTFPSARHAAARGRDDRLARPGRARHRARRRQGGLRRGRAARRSRARSPRSSASRPTRSRASTTIVTAERRARRRRAARISASAAAARCSTSTPAAQVAAKQRALEDALWHIGRVRPAQMLPRDPRPGLGLPPPRAAVGAPRRQEGRRAGRLPRAQVELRRRHDLVRGPAAEDLRAAAGAARAGRRR